MKKLLKPFLFLSFLLLSYGCGANQPGEEEIDAVKNKLIDMLPEEIEIISLRETDIQGFLEVNFKDIEPLYVTSDGNYLISGDIYSITKDGLVNKSEARRDFQRKTIVNKLNLDELITFEPADFIYNIFVFTDVDCGYCRQFHNQIDAYLDLGIRVNYLAYPRAGIGSESYKKIASAWCDTDPNNALTMLKQGQAIETKLCLENPVEKHFKMGNAMGVQGTPSIITGEGKMIPGYLPPKDLLNILEG
tara:strand:- start:1373 stop:2113 length:741 start_codon:yes stop_codon:yes gene_type:complete